MKGRAKKNRPAFDRWFDRRGYDLMPPIEFDLIIEEACREAFSAGVREGRRQFRKSGGFA